MLNNAGYMPKNKILRGVSEISILAMILTLGLPASIAFFSQRGSIKAQHTEKEFREATLAGGNKPNFYYFNRGL
jgi:hypothetical protein